MTAGDTTTDPDVAPPRYHGGPVQIVALVADQVSVELPPTEIVIGDAVSVTIGKSGPPLTVTVTDLPTGALPGDEQLIEYVVVASGATVADPLSATATTLPPGPQLPLHSVAFVELQINVDVEGQATPVGDALSVTEGGGSGAETATVADFSAEVPPAPEHEIE